MALPNGTVPDDLTTNEPAKSTSPSVLGINFGNSYASIAVFTKEGVAECIANEDGERQIACAVSFHGEQVYVGNQAKHQLVKNASNTIVGFRNLLGLQYSEIPQSTLAQSATSAPVIQHNDQPDTAAYKVEVLQPAPPPLPKSEKSVPPSMQGTPAASHAATPASEPTPTTRVLTVAEVTSIFLGSLLQSAEDFLGKKITGAVITCPSGFGEKQREALRKAADDAGIKVLQMLEDAGAAVATSTGPGWVTGTGDGSGEGGGEEKKDRTQLVVDVGASSVGLSLVAIRDGLGVLLASSSLDTNTGGDAIDSALLKFFSADFTKKTKVPLSLPLQDPGKASKQDLRAQAKLLLALEHTKRTLSASPGAATCSVESLKDGMDYTGTVNRLRFDLLAAPVYTSIASAITSLLGDASVDAVQVDEIVYVGGTASLPGLDEAVITQVGMREDVITPHVSGTAKGGGSADPTTVLSRGCAVQAALIAGLDAEEVEDGDVRRAFTGGESAKMKTVGKTLGVLFPGATKEGEKDEALGGMFIPVLEKDTPLPARRSVPISLPSSSKAEIWEAEEHVDVQRVKVPKVVYSDDEDAAGDEEEEDEYEEVKKVVLKKKRCFGVVDVKGKEGNGTVEVVLGESKGGGRVWVRADGTEVGGVEVKF